MPRPRKTRSHLSKRELSKQRPPDAEMCSALSAILRTALETVLAFAFRRLRRVAVAPASVASARRFAKDWWGGETFQREVCKGVVLFLAPGNEGGRG